MGGLRPDTSSDMIWTGPARTPKLGHRVHCGLLFCMYSRLLSVTTFLAFKNVWFSLSQPFLYHRNRGFSQEAAHLPGGPWGPGEPLGPEKQGRDNQETTDWLGQLTLVSRTGEV